MLMQMMFLGNLMMLIKSNVVHVNKTDGKEIASIFANEYKEHAMHFYFGHDKHIANITCLVSNFELQMMFLDNFMMLLENYYCICKCDR